MTLMASICYPSDRHGQYLEAVRSSWHRAVVLLGRVSRVPAVTSVRTAFFSALSHPVTVMASTCYPSDRHGHLPRFFSGACCAFLDGFGRWSAQVGKARSALPGSPSPNPSC